MIQPRAKLYRVESVAGAVARHARETPFGLAFRFLLDGDEDEAKWSYAKLDRTANRIAAQLRALDAEGQRVLLLYPPGPEYIAAFLGCLYAGAIAVPAYPPEPTRLARTLPRLRAMIADCSASVALTTEPIRELAESLLADVLTDSEPIRWIATDVLGTDDESRVSPAPVHPDDVAFLQYTSGSTTTPRGVMVTHGNLLHNIAAIHRQLGSVENFSGISWLPPYHDMGLIGGILAPLYTGLPATLLSPLDFLKRPARWLEAITRYRGTASPAPNFAYDLCVRKITAEQRARLDLSSWLVSFNGAEPIDAGALDRFVATFGPCGFRRETFLPCYGLAEATLIASGTGGRVAPTVRSFGAAALAQGRAEAAVRESAEESRVLVGTGRSIEDQVIEIVHPQTHRRCGPGQIGEIWLAGPSVASGYWNRIEENETTFNAHIRDDGSGPYLRTGDLGVLVDGELFVTGRIKDVIIVGGANHYPQDLERTVEACHAAIRPGASAAFAVPLEGHERVVIVCETDAPQSAAHCDEIRAAVRHAVAQEHQLPVHAIQLLTRGSIPRTSSGKIQRHACRDGYLASTLETHVV